MEERQDLISRQAAIEHLKKRLYETELNSTEKYPYYEEIADNRIDTWMNEVPSAQPEQRWIPCSKRLPEYGKTALWCNDEGSIFTTAITYMNGTSWAVGKRHRRCQVVAWMPLSEPYKEGDE